MKRYLLDANVLMQARRRHYHPDYCPGFWEWLDRGTADGEIFSIDAVLTEIRRGNDNLEGLLPGAFFLAAPDGIQEAMKTLAAWADGLPCTEARKNEFLGKADYLLVAHALCSGDVVVTHEKRAVQNSGKIQIPNACAAVGVESLDLWDVLRIRQASFVLHR